MAITSFGLFWQLCSDSFIGPEFSESHEVLNDSWSDLQPRKVTSSRASLKPETEHDADVKLAPGVVSKACGLEIAVRAFQKRTATPQ